MRRFRSKRRRTVGIAFGAERLFLRSGDGRRVETRLPENLLRPSSSEPNFSSTADAARALGNALERLSAPGGENSGGSFTEAVLAIPDRAVAVALLESAGAGGRRRLQADLAAGLAAGGDSGSRPAPGRVRFGTIPSGSFRRRSLLGACASAAVVSQYESVAAAVGLEVRWVDTPTLAILPEWLAAGRGAGERILAALHRRHFAVAAAAGNRLTAFRLKLRAALDPQPPAAAVRKLSGNAGAEAVCVRGEGAAEVRALLGLTGGPRAAEAEPGVGGRLLGSVARESVPGPASPIREDALAALLRRVGARPSALAPGPAAAAAV